MDKLWILWKKSNVKNCSLSISIWIREAYSYYTTIREKLVKCGMWITCGCGFCWFANNRTRRKERIEAFWSQIIFKKVKYFLQSSIFKDNLVIILYTYNTCYFIREIVFSYTQILFTCMLYTCSKYSHIEKYLICVCYTYI